MGTYVWQFLTILYALQRQTVDYLPVRNPATVSFVMVLQ